MGQIKEKDFYENTGAAYDSFMSSGDFKYFIDRRKEILRSLRLGGKDSLVLDLGCGTGIYRDAFEPGRNVIGMDYSLSALQGYRNKYRGSALVNADANFIPLKDGTVDVVVVFGLVHHLYDRIGILFSEIRRVLKIGGAVIIDEPNGCNLLWHLVSFSKWGRQIDGGFVKMLRPSFLRKILKEHNFRISSERHWGFFPPPLFKVKALLPLDGMLENSILRGLSIRFNVVAEKER